MRLCELENLRLCIRNRVGGFEEAEMRVADVRPDTHVGVCNRHKRADLPGVIHPQFHHRDVGPVSELHQRERQADVIVQVPLVLDDAVRLGEEVRNRVLRRRLSRAAGNRDDLCLCRFPYRVRQVLQSYGRVADFDNHGPADLRSAVTFVAACRSSWTRTFRSACRPASTITPIAPRLNASLTNSCPSKRAPRSAMKKSPSCSDRESVTTLPTT